MNLADLPCVLFVLGGHICSERPSGNATLGCPGKRPLAILTQLCVSLEAFLLHVSKVSNDQGCWEIVAALEKVGRYSGIRHHFNWSIWARRPFTSLHYPSTWPCQHGRRGDGAQDICMLTRTIIPLATAPGIMEPKVDNFTRMRYTGARSRQSEKESGSRSQMFTYCA
jgi:hypothetical protein